MKSAGPGYSKEEFARRGESVFDATVRARVANEPPHMFVLIDLIDMETGDSEVDADGR